MPSQYPSESQLSSRRGGKMVSVGHSPHVRGKAGHENAVTRRPISRKETGKGTGNEKPRQNGGLPHLVLVRAHHPKSNAVVASSPSAPLPAPNHAESVASMPVRAAVQTQAQPTSTVASTVVSGERTEGETSVCPQVALRYTTDVLSRWSDRVLSSQRSLDDRLQRLHSRVRGRQGRAMCRHVQSQIRSATKKWKGEEERVEGVEGERGEDEGSDVVLPAALSMQVDGAVDDIGTSCVARCLQFQSCDEPDQSKRNESSDSVEMEISVDVDTVQPKLEEDRPPPLLDKSNSSGESFRTSIQSNEFGNRSDGRCEVLQRWRQQLRGVCTGLGGGGEEREEGGGEGEVTDGSSDEEDKEDAETASVTQNRLQDICRKWERSRGPIGAKWAWLRHHITQVNRQLSQLDTVVQKRSKQDKFVLSSPSLPPRSATHPPSLWGVGMERGKVVNGTNHTPSIPHLLIPDAILNGPTQCIQVKDLLSPAPLSNMSFILDDVSGFTCARVRALHKKPTRRVVRLSRRKRFNRSHARKPILPRDTPSWVWLDEALHHVFRDHPYASIPRPKRHQRSVAYRTRPLTLSPSPGVGDRDSESPAKSAGQKRPLHDTPLQSPSLSRSSTPVPLPPFTTSTPSSFPYPLTSSLPRKKRLPSHAPSYDIDNIVIPYSVAAATRLEKLEYKEIITPRWRELETTPTDHTPSFSPTHGEVEDTSDDSFKTKHGRFEAVEKKRFMNFITGAQRKRARPSSLSSTPDPLQISPWPPTKVRRATFPASPSDPPSHPVPILSWPPRSFPLHGSDIDALTNPPPPPPLPVVTPRTSSSPSPLLSHPLTPSLPPTPSTSSVLVTPLGTPLSSPSTPYSENPISPSEWAVNPQIVPAKPTSNTPSSIPEAIVLRLTKKS